jgi:ferredoxin
VKVAIDEHKCEGTAYCVRIAPGAFRLSADGKAEPLREEYDASEGESLREAEQTCPTSAIRVSA